MKVAILLLCHESPEQIALRLSSPFFASPDVKVYVHYDARHSAVKLARLKAALPAGVQVEVLDQRVRCAWGEYSLVEATHRLMHRALADTNFAPDYLALISGSCIPFRPLASFQEFLRRRRGIDFIQAVDISRRKWVKEGLESERFRYYFPVNFLKHRGLFDWLTEVQRNLGVKRRQPEGLRVHFGSQWFCLTRETAARVAARLDEPELQTFFKHSWIPDEFAIQTLVANVQNPAFVSGYNLTYYEFDEQGRPLVLENGHTQHLMQQPFFFARKVAPEATDLTREVNAHVAGREFDLSYFKRAGEATSDYLRFLARANTLRSARAHVGTLEDAWRGPMEFNNRHYFVLFASSKTYLEHLLTAMRAQGKLPVFDYVFDPLTLVAASEQGSWRGIQSGMRARRDFDPGAFLHELVSIDSQVDTAFAIDPAIACWARNFVIWDPNATLVFCDPPDMNKQQQAEAAIREMSGAGAADLMTRTLNAGVSDTQWLPQAHFAQAVHERKHSCRVLRLQDITDSESNPTLQALKKAVSRVDWWRFYARRAEAQSLLRDAHQQTF